jgi:hypothetical protein
MFPLDAFLLLVIVASLKAENKIDIERASSARQGTGRRDNARAKEDGVTYKTEFSAGQQTANGGWTSRSTGVA